MQRPVVGRVNDEAMKEGFLLDLHLVCGAPRLALRLVWPDFFFFSLDSRYITLATAGPCCESLAVRPKFRFETFKSWPPWSKLVAYSGKHERFI